MNRTQIGWKVWYRRNNNTAIFTSRTHVWEDLPAQGVQYLQRYYEGPNGHRWKDMINAKDLYTEFAPVPSDFPQTYVKLGTTRTHAEMRPYYQVFRDSYGKRYPIDNTVPTYERNKTLDGWQIGHLNGENIDMYDSKNHTIEEVPNTDIIILRRMMSDGNYRWSEEIYNFELYVLGSDAEIALVTENSKAKRGTMINTETLDIITKEASEDRSDI